MRVVLCFSGGLDSTVLLYDLLDQGHEVIPLAFEYGQRHIREVNAALEVTISLGLQLRHAKLTLPFAHEMLPPRRERRGQSKPAAGPLVGDATVIPVRNLLFLSHAAVHAYTEGAEAVAYAANKTDADIYPDCRETFAAALDEVLRFYRPRVRVMRPYVNVTKAEIVQRGYTLRVPFTKTWSCYEGLAVPCGTCGACVERAKALGTHENQGMTFARVKR